MIQNWKKNVLLFMISQTISLFGSSLVQYAITWYITLKTQSGSMMTIAIICGFLPTFFLSPFAGVWADRYNRKILIVLSDSMIAISTLLLAILFFMGYDSVWLLFVTLSIRAFGAGIQTPTVGAVLPQLVPEENLTRINAINGSIQSLVLLISPMLSGVLLMATSIELIFFIDVITAAIAVSIMLLFLHIPTHAKATEKQTHGYLSDFAEGIEYIKHHDFIKTLCLFNTAFFLLAAPVAFLTPLQITRSFGNDVWRLTTMEIVFSAGMTIGGILMATWGGFKNRVHTMVLCNIVIGFLTVLLGTIPVFWIYLIFMGFIGVALAVFNTPYMVLLQQKVQGDFLGRVFGVIGMISSSMMPLGMLIFGPMADFIKIEWLLIGTGFFMVVESVIMYQNKIMIEAGKPVND